MKFKMGHLAYLTRNMDKALAFYRDALGFRHAFSLSNDKGEPWIEYLMAPDGRFIELFHPEGYPLLPGNAYMHLCLEVEDIEAAVAELESKGVVIRIRPTRGSDSNLQAWIDDPDGRAIELMQLSAASPQSHARGTLSPGTPC